MPEKPKLKARIIPVFRVHYQDLEQYIQRVFGVEFDFLFGTGFVKQWLSKRKTCGQAGGPRT